MDWTTILKAQQTDFIQRLKSGDLLHCEKEGQHSELTVISGERLKQLRDFCWEMANKFKQQSDVKNIFFNNMKGKLGEEVVKICLGDFVTEVDYEKYSSGDGKIDFTLTSDSSVGIQVKTRYGYFDKVQWTIDREEIEKNAVLVCVLCQEEFSEMEKEYGLIIAGFLPTNMIKSAANEAIVGIDELLYPGGLRGYLDSLVSYDADKYISLGDECLFDKKDYKSAILNYSHALELRANEVITYYLSDAIIYYKRGIAFSLLGSYQNAIYDCNRAITIDASYHYYYCRGSAHYSLGDMQGAIYDFTQAINMNSKYVIAYYNRGNAYYTLGKYQDAINDYNQVINLDQTFAIAYYNRGSVNLILGNKQGAIDDFNKAASIYKQENNFHDYHKTLEQLKNIQSDDVELKSVVGINPLSALHFVIREYFHNFIFYRSIKHIFYPSF
jgi:tetratricopeptide (TPR) repeat protein